jgi:hypothetical protein
LSYQRANDTLCLSFSLIIVALSRKKFTKISILTKFFFRFVRAFMAAENHSDVASLDDFSRESSPRRDGNTDSPRATTVAVKKVARSRGGQELVAFPLRFVRGGGWIGHGAREDDDDGGQSRPDRPAGGRIVERGVGFHHHAGLGGA